MKGTTLQFGAGELGTITSAAIHAGTVGKFGYRLSVGRDQNQEWRNRDSLAFRSHKINLQSEYQLPGQSRFLFSGGLVVRIDWMAQSQQLA
jgi:iron complex outermembrane recepter protein